MKKYIILFSTILCLTASLNAQIALQEGTKTIGGSVSYMSNTEEYGSTETKRTNIVFQPQYSRFVSDNIEIGFEFLYSHSKLEQNLKYADSYVKYSYSYTIETKILGIGTLFNTYFPSSETVAPFLGAGLSILVNPDQADNKFFNLYGQGGIAVFINSYSSVNLKVQYALQNSFEGDAKSNTLLFSIGMNYYLLKD